MKPLKLVFMGTPHFAVPTLQALIDSPHEVIAVYSQPPRPSGRGLKETPSPVHQLALTHSIPVFTPVSLKDPQTQQQFRELGADTAIVAAYGLLLPPAILEAYPMGCINVHPSLLPRWRGAAPIQRSVMAGDKETGIVIMQMDQGLDTGDMLTLTRYAIPPEVNAGQLHDILAKEAGPLVLQALEGLQTHTITPKKQLAEGVTYATKITKEEYRIDWNESAVAIYNKVRGLSPSPGATFSYGGETIKLLEAEVVDAKGSAGTVLDDQLTIACGERALRPLLVQRPGKKPMSVAECLRGFTIPEGAKVQ